MFGLPPILFITRFVPALIAIPSLAVLLIGAPAGVVEWSWEVFIGDLLVLGFIPAGEALNLALRKWS